MIIDKYTKAAWTILAISNKRVKLVLALTVVCLFMIALNVACAPEPEYSKTRMLTGYSGNYTLVEIECPDHLKNRESDSAKRIGRDIKTQSLKAKLTALLKKHERILVAKEDLLASKRSLWFSSLRQVSEHQVSGCVQ